MIPYVSAPVADGWRPWRLACGHEATGRADAVPGKSRLYCPDEPVFHDQEVSAR